MKTVDFSETIAVSDLKVSYCKVKFGNLGISIGKVKTVDFSETIAASEEQTSN